MRLPSRARARRASALAGAARIALAGLTAVGSLAAVEAQATPGLEAGDQAVDAAGAYGRLTALFEQWRAFERPRLVDGVPDYTAAAMVEKHRQLRSFQARLAAIDPSGWPIEQQVDHHLVRAEMNGLDFNLRVLRPWARDPAFYTSVWTEQSDTPAHEGPTHHAPVELWQYEFPLTRQSEAKLTGELATIPPLLAQARGNLVGNARELWLAGIGNLRGQASDLADLGERTPQAGGDLRGAIAAARRATLSFVAWLEEQAPSKTGPSGIGKDNYTWYLKNVHLVPLSWEEEVSLLRRELARAHASLRLEEHRNRALPPLAAISSPEEFDRRANTAVTEYLDFLEREDVLPVRGYMDPALRARIGSYVPPERRNFFQTAIHFEPMTLWTHFYHWWDLARMEAEPHPSPIRRGPLLYNIFDSRAEGMATGVEEMMMHAGLYDRKPRVREIVWIMLAQRAARGLGSLYAHANELTLKQARDFHVEWTPRGWMREDLDLLGFEQQLYLRQPGYGTSYVSGKYLIERLLAERAKQLGDGFTLSGFFAEVDAAGVIPVSLIRWQLTGNDDEIRALASGDAETPTAACRPVPGLAELLAPGAVLLLGELHGTAQSPAFLLDVACHAVAAGLPTVVGLELTPVEEGRVTAYLDSAGSEDDRRALLAGDVWQREYQDGRNSAAMSGVIEGIHGLRRRDGAAIRLSLFDAPYDRRRDANMADNIARAARQNADGVTLILTGNLHSRVTPGGGSEPMGYLLAEALAPGRVVSLDVAHRGGTAWLCFATPEGQQCGSVKVRGRGPESGTGITLAADPEATGHHGWYRVGAITASPPAKTVSGGEPGRQPSPLTGDRGDGR